MATIFSGWKKQKWGLERLTDGEAWHLGHAVEESGSQAEIEVAAGARVASFQGLRSRGCALGGRADPSLAPVLTH